MIDKITSILNRTFFAIAIFLFFISVLKWFIHFFGYTINFFNYQPGRLLELSVFMLIFVVVLLLRQIRELLKK